MNKADAIKWARDILAKEFIVLDAETTGLESYDQPVQVAVVDKDGKALFDSLIKPTVPVGSAAFSVHRITDGMLFNAPTLAQVREQLFSIMAGRTAVAFNVDFDRRILHQGCLAHKIPYIGSATKWECLMKAYAAYRSELRYDGNYKWHSLENACRQQGIAYTNGHTALGDAKVTLELLRKVANG